MASITESVKHDSEGPSEDGSIRDELFELMRISPPGAFQDAVVGYIKRKQLEERQEILAYLEHEVPTDNVIRTVVRLIGQGAHKR